MRVQFQLKRHHLKSKFFQVVRNRFLGWFPDWKCFALHSFVEQIQGKKGKKSKGKKSKGKKDKKEKKETQQQRDRRERKEQEKREKKEKAELQKKQSEEGMCFRVFPWVTLQLYVCSRCRQDSLHVIKC